MSARTLLNSFVPQHEKHPLHIDPDIGPHQPTVIVVLGGSNDQQGRLSPMSEDRCLEALKVHRQHPTYPLLMTGGWGDHFNQSPWTHGHLQKEILIQQGIPPDSFLPIVLSSHTRADAVEAARVLSRSSPRTLILITSDFHIPRACHYFQAEFPHTRLVPHPAPSRLAPQELERRIQHEQMRMKSLRQQSPPSPPQA